AASDANSSLLRVLGLELDAEAGAGAKIARAISGWREGQSAEGERDRGLAGALLAELAGDVVASSADLERARTADPTHEGAARVAPSQADPDTAARILAQHAGALEGGPRTSLLLTEAALRLLDARRDDDVEPMLWRAAKTDATLPFAAYIGE